MPELEARKGRKAGEGLRMMWRNPSTMTTEAIELELASLGDSGETEARLFRLRSELAFRRSQAYDLDRAIRREERRASTYHAHAQFDPELEQVAGSPS